MTTTENPPLPPPTFFNVAQVEVTPDAVNFTLGIRATGNENPAFLARLMTTPQFAKIFLSALAQTLEVYEKKLGEIKTPGIDSANLQARIRALCTLKNEDLN